MHLMGAQAVRQRAVGGLADDAQALKPLRRGAASIAVVINQRMLGRQSPLGLIPVLGQAGGGEEDFERGVLSVLVEIRLRTRQRGGGVGPEAGIVLLPAAAGRGDDDAVGGRQAVDEGRAGRSALHDDHAPLQRFQPFGEFRGGHVRSRQIELCLLAVERAVPDERQPEVGGRIGRRHQRGLQALPAGRAARFRGNLDGLTPRSPRGLEPGRGGLFKNFRVIGLTRRANNDHEGRGGSFSVHKTGMQRAQCEQQGGEQREA